MTMLRTTNSKNSGHQVRLAKAMGTKCDKFTKCNNGHQVHQMHLPKTVGTKWNNCKKNGHQVQQLQKQAPSAPSAHIL